jgi:hypothetical protein
MSNYVNMDMTLGDLTSYVLSEYKEPIAGSLEMPVDMVEDKINEVYMDIFNSPELLSVSKKATHSFTAVEDQLLDGDVAIGSVTLDLVDATNFPVSGYGCIDGHDFFTYSGKSSNQLTGVTGIKTAHISGESVKLGYAMPTGMNFGGMDNPILTSNVPFSFIDSNLFFNQISGIHFYTFFNNYIFVSSTDSRIFSFLYEVVLTLLSTTTDKPTLIPGSFRPGLLGSGAVAKLGVRDDMRTGWDYHATRYLTELKKFIAKQNNPVKSRSGSTRPTIYD